MDIQEESSPPAEDAAKIAPLGSAIPMEVSQGDDYVQMFQPGEVATKGSHSCCGCCCDTRRAVIVVNVISLSFSAIAISSLLLYTSDDFLAQIADDEVRAALEDQDGLGLAIGLTSLGMICHGLGIYGAAKFVQWPIIVAAIWYLSQFVRGFVAFNPAMAIMSGFFAYPHIIFWHELRNGIMSPTRYPHEKQCCDCC